MTSIGHTGERTPPDALCGSEGHPRLFIELAPEAIAALDADLRYLARPWRHPDGTVGGLVMYPVEDVTERTLARRTNDDPTLAAATAAAADRARAAFLAAMSHELRTPLNAIIGFSSLMLDGLTGGLNDEQRKQLGIVRDSGQQLLALVDDILDVARLESRRNGGGSSTPTA
jgi:signal transduction histidine kinase